MGGAAGRVCDSWADAAHHPTHPENPFSWALRRPKRACRGQLRHNLLLAFFSSFAAACLFSCSRPTWTHWRSLGLRNESVSCMAACPRCDGDSVCSSHRRTRSVRSDADLRDTRCRCSATNSSATSPTRNPRFWAQKIIAACTSRWHRPCPEMRQVRVKKRKLSMPLRCGLRRVGLWHPSHPSKSSESVAAVTLCRH